MSVTTSPERLFSSPTMSGPGAALTAPALIRTCVGGPDMADRTCTVAGCPSKHYCRGWCQRHYRRWRAHGDPTKGKAAPGEPQAWLQNIVSSGDRSTCWEWPFGRDRAGYGIVSHQPAHRVAKALDGAPVPDGLMARHRCDNPPCVNPDHIEPGTHQDNTDDMTARERQARGSRSSRSALTEDDVREIRRRAAIDPKVSRKALAEEFGCSPPAISYVISGKSWGWLDA